jgi:peptidase M20/M25/M40-like protein
MAALDTVLAKIDANLDLALARFFKLVEIPSVSTDPAYASECAKAAEWLVAELRGIGFEASAHPTAGHPIIVGQAKAARPDVPHVLFYGHYDVQPPDPLDLWESPPFEPRVVKAETHHSDDQRRCQQDDAQSRLEREQEEGRGMPLSIIVLVHRELTEKRDGHGIGAASGLSRGVCDDKGQLMTFVEACRAFKETGGLLCHITFLIEGEEETAVASGFSCPSKAELKSRYGACLRQRNVGPGDARDYHHAARHRA